MNFIGIGNDIIEINRIEKAIKKANFITKVFTENEIKLFEIKVIELNFLQVDSLVKKLSLKLSELVLESFL